MYALITLNTGHSNKVTVELYNEDRIFEEFVNRCDEYKVDVTHDRIKLDPVEDVTKLMMHKYIWEREGHSIFVWIVECEDKSIEFNVDLHTLDNGKKECISYDDNVIHSFFWR